MRVSTAAFLLYASKVSAQAVAYAQCGGIGFSGSTTCVSGWTCTYANAYYSQCLPGTGSSSTSASTSGSSTSATSSGSSVSLTASGTSTSTSASASATGLVKYAGVNIAGFDFGMTTDGTQDISGVTPPISSLGGPDGASQMQHFVQDDGMNIFRLPVGWQYLTNNVLGGTLNSENAANYDQLVQACLATGASCIIDIHNYARWNGAVIGQGGPTDVQFAALWTSLATKYAKESSIVFGVMNEPHDLSSLETWAQSVQTVVTAIRTAGATSQTILLPGTDYTSAGDFVSNGSGAALLNVTNLDGSTTNLVFDVHKYLDSDNSGTNSECVTNNIDNAFQPLATWLRSVNRQALNSETGGGNVASCAEYLCEQIAFVNDNSDVYLGYVGWAAGSFDSSYVLSETPTGDQDTSLVKACLAR